MASPLTAFWQRCQLGSSAPLLLAGFQGQVPIADWVSPPPQTSPASHHL